MAFASLCFDEKSYPFMRKGLTSLKSESKISEYSIGNCVTFQYRSQGQLKKGTEKAVATIGCVQ